ncbi:E3 ubiquitin-protein ligase NEURL3 [Frankliniella fusca]|uniref:E3 ubiquitin-protein ligase NEURL3 n=1 Tax=Frankliniella fusca TaxID=407009 RepID=A0AAE1HG03_9NEOP|nr:E3 ubiquitin-protein ligase NEURL3 [Frankliniella fusca]
MTPPPPPSLAIVAISQTPPIVRTGQNVLLRVSWFRAAGSAAQAQHQQMVPWGPMGPAAAHANPMYYSWPQGPMMSQQNVAVKPWEVEISDSSSDSDCFQPSQKRGPGRPKKEKKADQDFSASVPEAPKGSSVIASSPKDRSSECNFWKGNYLLKPCGHAKYCRLCVNRLRDESIKMKRLSKCLNADCYDLVTGWLLLINVSA